jgi:selenoprotein W-related protein
LTEKLLNAGKQRIQALELSPFGDGRFEVYKNGQLIYSKMDTGNFPDEDALVKQIL